MPPKGYKLSVQKKKKEQLLKALEKTLGVVTSACRSVGVSRDFFYDHYHNDPEFKKRVDDIENIALDYAETQLHKQIGEGEVSATIFYLKTKGKKRGYVERTEQDVNVTQPVQINLIEK